MVKVYQTKFKNEGNCFAACIASIFHEDIQVVPHLGEDEEWRDYEKELNSFLRHKHSTIVFYGLFKDWNEFVQENLTDSYYIASGPSKSGFEHAVVYKNDEIVHDPNPENNGIEFRETIYMFLKILK